MNVRETINCAVSRDFSLPSQDGVITIPRHDKDVATLVAALDEAVNLANLERTPTTKRGVNSTTKMKASPASISKSGSAH